MPTPRKKSERFILSVEPEWLERVDRWRATQQPIPSRAEAVRSMVTAALTMMKVD